MTKVRVWHSKVQSSHLQTSAFTMLELVMVIVVLGILAAMALPRLDRDLRQEAADNLLSAIRYTQHMALIDNKANPRRNDWQQALWQIRFSNWGGEWQYTVASDSNHAGNLAQNESAIDPSSGKFMHTADAIMDNAESPNIFLTQKYGINNVIFNGCANGGPNAPAVGNSRHIAFDYLGRPHRAVTIGGNRDSRTVVTNGNCTITFTFLDAAINPIIIDISRETGYVQIRGQNAS